MAEPKTTCQACGVAVLVATAQATGGYCRSGKCEAARRLVRCQAKRIKRRPTTQCPQCGMDVRSSRLERHLSEKCEMRPCARAHPYAATLPHTLIPAWLERLANANSLPTLIPLGDVLQGSCFYPSSGLDSSPVLLANGCVHSFIFVDYSTSRDAFSRAVSFRGFSPYQMILQRDIARHEIVPADWAAQVPLRFDNPGFDGRQRLLDAQRRCSSFGHWSIWLRREGRGEEAGPRMFSLLFLGGEAVASYQELYGRNKLTPKVMAIIQPGHACGDNWSNFYDPDAPLWEAVSAGDALPDYLLVGSYGRRGPEECPFGGYTFVQKAITRDGQLRTIDIFTKGV